MPFTFSHPALVIPLLHARRRWPWLSATGLIAGSLAPDFEKFFKLHLASRHSHTAASIFYFSCPVSLGLAFIFHLLVRRPLLAHLPTWLYRRVENFAQLNWLFHFRHHHKGVMLSIVLGAAGHLLWDGFTHPNYLTINIMPFMSGMVQIGSHQMQLYQVSEIVNSVLGGLVVMWAMWRLPKRPVTRRPAANALWPYWSLAALVASAFVIQWSLLGHIHWINSGITAISAFMAGVVVASVFFQRKGWVESQSR